MSFAEQMGRNVAHHGAKTNVSQEELGVRSSLHRTAMGRLKRGERIPRADTFIEVAESLDIFPGDPLCGWVREPDGTIVGSFREQP